jgi:hypothetical protein
MDGVMARFNHVAAWPAGPKQPIFAEYASASSSHNTDAKPGNSFEVYTLYKQQYDNIR